jgi:hypothetical protein
MIRWANPVAEVVPFSEYGPNVAPRRGAAGPVTGVRVPGRTRF